jgi:nucleotide-binding universal stress UspA family protein
VVELKSILCPVDLSELSILPLRNAAAVATWYGAQVTALHIVPTFDAMEVHPGELFDPVRIVYPVRREEILEQLRHTVTTAGIAPDQVTLAAEEGEPVATIVDQSVARKSDLVVMGTHGRSGLDGVLLGSVTERVLRKASCPVLTVPPHMPGATMQVRLFSIVCAVDFSAASLQAVGFALDVARRAHARVTLLHVIEWLAEHQPPDYVELDVSALRHSLTRHADERLHALITQEAPVEGGVTTRVVVGRAHRKILEVAEEDNASLIVMGAQGRGGIALALLGSTTDQVIRTAACPVLTVRAPLI